jgi:hypothetical protein
MQALSVAKWNKFDGFAYSTLADDLDMVRPALAEFGLGFTQDVETTERSVIVTTTLFHVSGEERVGKPITFPVLKPTPQEFVKAAGWGRKMGAQAMFGIAADSDGTVEGPREATKERGDQKQQGRREQPRDAKAGREQPRAEGKGGGRAAPSKEDSVWNRLVKHAKAEGLPVVEVRLWETPNCFAAYGGI